MITLLDDGMADPALGQEWRAVVSDLNIRLPGRLTGTIVLGTEHAGESLPRPGEPWVLIPATSARCRGPLSRATLTRAPVVVVSTVGEVGLLRRALNQATGVIDAGIPSIGSDTNSGVFDISASDARLSRLIEANLAPVTKTRPSPVTLVSACGAATIARVAALQCLGRLPVALTDLHSAMFLRHHGVLAYSTVTGAIAAVRYLLANAPIASIMSRRRATLYPLIASRSSIDVALGEGLVLARERVA